MQWTEQDYNICIMPKLGVPLLPFSKNPLVRIELACDCNGEECDRVWLDGEEPIDLPAHFHLIEFDPGAVTACYAIGGDLPPANPFEPSHYY